MFSFSAVSDVFNKSDAVVWIKPELSGLAFSISGGENYLGVQDGFSFVCNEKHIVYKLVDTVDAVISESCEVITSSNNMFYAILQGIIGGKLYKAPDSTWELLFTKGLK